MAGRQDRLVRDIRVRRRTLVRSVKEAVGPLDPLRESVRRHPAAWAVGGALAGLVATRAFGATLARNGRRLAGTWVEHRVGDAVLGAVMKAAAVVSAELHTPQNHDQEQVQTAPPPAESVETPSAQPEVQ